MNSGLGAEESTVDDRISPFNTPPNSDDGIDLYPNTHRTSNEMPDWPTRALKDRKPQRSVMHSHRAPVEIKGSPPPQPLQRSGIKVDSVAQDHSQTQTTHGKPPELPPRPEIKSHVSSTPVPNTPLRASTTITNSRDMTVVSHTPLLNTVSGQPFLQQIRKDTVEHPLQSGHPRPQPRLVGPSEITSNTVPRTHNTLSQLDLSQTPHVSLNKTLPLNSVVGKKGDHQSEYPDDSNSSRRPPWARNCGSHVIHTNYETKLFDMCAGHACCAGQLMRVWDLSSGKLIVSLATGEKDVKATAFAFKPGYKSAEEGSRLWVGTNYGDLQEIDILTHKVIFSKVSAHSGHVVVKIHRYQNTMWTVDEEGTLLVWSQSDRGLPTLESRPTTHKVLRGHVASVVVGGQLWFATRKDIRVYRPSADESGQSNMEQQLSSQAGVGEITSSAVVEGQLDKVYFGHTDGNISIYSTTNFACLGTVNVSVYKINCLVGAGSHLWAGYNTGKICVYGVQSMPWKVIKDYHAHEGPVVSLSVDRSSLWLSGQLRVGSLSLDNTIRLWDGLLEQDWLGRFKRRLDNTYQQAY